MMKTVGRVRQGVCVLGVVSLVAAAGYGGAQEWTPFRGAVDAPDVMGGYASNQVLVRVAPGVEPVRLEGERWSFGEGPDALALSDVLEAFDAIQIRRAIDPMPANAAIASRIGLDRYFIVEVPAGTDTPDMIARLHEVGAGDGGPLELAELDGIGGVLTTPNDPEFGRQYGLSNTGQTVNGQSGVVGADISALDAWALTTGSSDVIVAVIDTGISSSHPDLQGNLISGWNVQDNNSNTDDSWLISHGTHCAGIIGAVTDNGEGIAGVAWEVSLMPIRVLGLFGSGTETDIAGGITWSTDNGADIASMSLGFPGTSSIIASAATYAHQSGVLLVAATGNTPTDPIAVPANLPEVVAVGATDNRDQIATFTTTGPEMSLVAPGVDVYSTWDTLFSANTYSYQSGTSMACPHVAGVAALMLSANPDLSNEQLWDLLESTADDLGSTGWNPTFGHGRVNAAAAVQAAIDAGSTCPADLNGDGILDINDMFIYLSWFEANDPRADLNNDGELDITDFFIYLDLFAQGC